MSETTIIQLIQKGEEQFEAGRVADALATFESALEKDPENIAALNDAGIAATELKRTLDAVKYFEKALSLKPDFAAAFYGLIDALLKAEQFEMAIEAFLQYHEDISEDEEKAKYSHALADWAAKQTSNGASSNGSAGRPTAGPNNSFPAPKKENGLKIAVICGPGRAFITDVENGLREKGHAVHPCYFDDKIDLQRIQQAMDWADVTWFEWCDQFLMAASKKLRKTSKVVCRLHGYEIFAGYPSKVNWGFVDRLIFVASHKRDLFNEMWPEVAVEMEIVRNGIDIERFTPAGRKSNTKNLVLLGHLNYRKGLPMLLQFYSELLHLDDEYHLYIRGQWQDRRYQMAVNTMIEELGLQKDISFVTEWIDDLNAWLADKSHILSFSLEESFHYAVGEAMAAGLMPVVHAWRESRDIWPEEFIFRNADEFLKLVLEKPYEPDAYRSYVEQHYLLNEQLEQLEAVLGALHSERPEPKGQPAMRFDDGCSIVTGRVSIVIPTLTIDYLRECLASIEANTRYPNYRIIIVNDGSKELDLLRFLESTKHRVIHLDENVGFAKANNAGFRASTGEYVMTLNADTLVHEGWLTTLVGAFQQNPFVAAAAPTVIDMGTSVIQSAGSRWDATNIRKFEVMHQGEELIPQHVANTCYKVDGCVGVCVLFRRAPLFDVELFDEGYLNGWEDMDLCMALLNGGYLIMHAPSVVEHKGSFIRNTFDITYYRELVSRNRAYFMSKWQHHTVQQHELVAPVAT